MKIRVATIPPPRRAVAKPIAIKMKTATLISSRAMSRGECIEARLIELATLDEKTHVAAGTVAILRVVDSRPGTENGLSAPGREGLH